MRDDKRARGERKRSERGREKTEEREREHL